jgi:SAM-dependent methyltransferase
MTPRFIARQLSCPSGLPGRIIGGLMNRRNLRMNSFAVKRLELTPRDRVLEIGFGGGVALPALLSGARYVAGLDRSRDVVCRARERYAAAVAEGRAEFRVGAVESLPFVSKSFEKVCTVNTVYFWGSLERGFGEIYRVLTCGGTAVVGFLPKQWMDRMGVPEDIFTARTLEEVTDALFRAGFARVRAERPEEATPWSVVIADK